MLAGTRLRKERIEGIVAAAEGLVARHLSIKLDTFFIVFS